MRRSYVPASASGIMALILAGAAWADAVPRVVQSQAFFEALAFGETLEIVRNGRIAIEAKCEADAPDPDNPDEFRGALLSLLVTTTVPGVAGIGLNNFLVPDAPEDHRRMFFLADSAAPFPSLYTNENRRGHPGSLIAPTGEVILMDGGTLGMGLNLFNGADCLVLGKYHTFKGRF